MPSDVTKRREKYSQLRQAGFSAKEANQLKDRTQSKIDELCQLNMEYLKQRNEMIVNQTKKKRCN